jgi:hypothetical protein
MQYMIIMTQYMIMMTQHMIMMTQYMIMMTQHMIIMTQYMIISTIMHAIVSWFGQETGHHQQPAIIMPVQHGDGRSSTGMLTPGTPHP